MKEPKGRVIAPGRRLSVALAMALAVALLAVPVAVIAGDNGATAKANLHPENQSGVKGKIVFEDNGVDTITMSGTAWGLDPAGTYVSLIYDNGSVPGGPFACEPTGPDLFGKMLVGEGGFAFTWVVDSDGHGTITGTNFLDEELFGDTAPPFPPGAYVSVDDFKTISIRHLEAGFALVACGQVASHPAG
jgi:hypothetical protein